MKPPLGINTRPRILPLALLSSPLRGSTRGLGSWLATNTGTVSANAKHVLSLIRTWPVNIIQAAATQDLCPQSSSQSHPFLWARFERRGCFRLQRHQIFGFRPNFLKVD